MIIVADAWKTGYPGAAVGVLVMRNVANPDHHPELARRKTALENQLRSRFASYTRAALGTLPSLQPYTAYFNRYKKTYHVQLQLESVALKGKSLPRVAALVEAMFMAELKNQLLTAGHDFDAVQRPVTLDVAKGHETYILLSGQEQTLKPGDMMMADARGVISSVLYGPDGRTRITSDTRQVFFVVYAPPGVGAPAVHQHLDDIRSNVMLVSPNAEVESLTVCGTEAS